MNNEEKFYKSDFFLTLLCLIFPPVGFIWFWLFHREKSWSVKIIVSILLIACIYLECDVANTIKKIEQPKNHVVEQQVQTNQLTLDKVIELSKKGENLDWKDFEEFEQRNVGKSGYDIIHFPIDDTFELIVSGMWGVKPDEINLTLISDNTINVDIRRENVQEFIEKNIKQGEE